MTMGEGRLDKGQGIEAAARVDLEDECGCKGA
jgi:hypothetical protein